MVLPPYIKHTPVIRTKLVQKVFTPPPRTQNLNRNPSESFGSTEKCPQKAAARALEVCELACPQNQGNSTANQNIWPAGCTKLLPRGGCGVGGVLSTLLSVRSRSGFGAFALSAPLWNAPLLADCCL